MIDGHIRSEDGMVFHKDIHIKGKNADICVDIGAIVLSLLDASGFNTVECLTMVKTMFSAIEEFFMERLKNERGCVNWTEADFGEE